MIPKTIHYVWVGGAPKPPIVQMCIESWRRFCPGWEIREWGDETVMRIGVRYAKEAYAQRKWAFVADWLRLYVLHEYGGFYLDTDMEMLKPIDDLAGNRLTMGLVDRHGKVLFNGGVIGCERGDETIGGLLGIYDDIPFVKSDGELDQTPNTVRMVDYFAKRWNLVPERADRTIDMGDGRMFYPHDFFLSRGGYTYHHYCASWLDDWIRKVWLSIGPYKLVRFKKRKEAKSDAPSLLPGESRMAGLRLSKRKTVWIVRVPPDPAKTIHVAIACNDAYAFPARVLISCVLRHVSAPVRFHLLSTGISDDSIASLRSLFRPGSQHGLDVYNNLAISFPLSPHCAHISRDTYLRFLLPEVLVGIDKVIYLDIDLLVRGDIAPLWNADIGTAAIAGVVEEQMFTNGYPQSIGMKPGAPYFNAGVLLMNLLKIRQLNLSERWKQIAAKGEFRFLDEDIINIACEGMFAELSMFWNFNLYYYRVYKAQKRKAKIIHFTGPEKPWTNPKAGRHCNREWRKAAAIAGKKDLSW